MSAAVVAERPYQDYSLDQKAEVLALVEANGGNVQQTSRDTGIPHQTIRFWLTNNGKYSNVQSAKRTELAEKLENIAHQCADLLPTMLPSANVREVVGAMAQSVEKMQLLRGQPTSITESVERQELVVILESALGAGVSEAIEVPASPISGDSDRNI